MLAQFHPFFERDYPLWWPYIYFILLFLLLTAGVYLTVRLLRIYKAGRPDRKAVSNIKSQYRRGTDVMFLKTAAMELFMATNRKPGSTFSYPCGEWLDSLSGSDSAFASYPFSLLVDVCYKPDEEIPPLTGKERTAIQKLVVKQIRRYYV